MNYYWFNRQEALQKAKEKYSKEKAAEYYAQNKEAIKEKSREKSRVIIWLDEIVLKLRVDIEENPVPKPSSSQSFSICS